MSEEGKGVLLDSLPLTDPEKIEYLKQLGRAWTESLNRNLPVKFTGWPPVSDLLPLLKVEGASLSIEDVYALGLFCRAVTELHSWAGSRQVSELEDRLGLLAGEAGEIPELSQPSSEIFKIIDTSGKLRDLPELRQIREKIRKTRQDIDKLIGKYTADENIKHMLQSTVPTIKDGRQVIALRANFRGRIRGLVHEVSQSGQTLYLEPEDVVDRNNDLVTEEHHLARETARILRDLTARLSPFYEDLVSAAEKMVFLDGIGAAARWGREYKCIFPEPAGQTPFLLKLRGARHPLLKAKAVPIDLALTQGRRTLIITGPNTGGKTVTLKTVALFALLNQSGWPLPASEETFLPVFDFIGCDIGDEQSLNQSLSTFSGHMKNIAEILQYATENSLVLLDELGSGTDPQEGSAIAMAVLDELLKRRSIVLVTTHHGILKNYGYTHEECINASVDFDQSTLCPTYRILMGIPGESHALDIAARNGLDLHIVEQAKNYLVEERADISALIRGLTSKHEELDRFTQKKKEEESVLREKQRRADLQELRLRQKEVELREQGYRRLSHLFDDSRKQLENLVREIRENELTREKTVEMKNWMSDFEKLVASESESLEAARNENDARLRELAGRERTYTSPENPSSGGRRARRNKLKDILPGDYPAEESLPEFAPGLEVFAGPSRRRGTLVRPDKKGSWIVAVDSMKISFSEKDILPALPSGTAEKLTVEIHTEMDTAGNPVLELRLLGMRSDEAVKALERQLDLAALNNLKEFSVVHGKGNGVLQEAVQRVLGENPSVADFYFARPEHGGSGKTIVCLR
ncbi:Smr/MutS family protein [Brucepastera parasyntrophica]|uniref:endonuclease MutS2 n=1 Tax=Brucepastera parasyntrophica TaxID=2880008 RepID=UPI00210B6678|nr:Smr/MutS family protein [Brucepastera parasyntrophica]ULQ59566.1 Smr/MutS family protein [Brucepastera parasyntrophica]